MKSRRTLLLGLLGTATLTPILLTSSVKAMDNDRNNNAPIGTIYTASNATTGNSILGFDQFKNGKLRAIGSTPTGGTGTGKGLGNQNGLTLSPDRRWLFAVNAGSNEISVFNFKDRQPQFVSKVNSGGIRPVGITIQGDRLYVLNAGSDNIVGFYLKEWGELQAIPNSQRSLSGTGTAPAQVRFSPDGEFLVVTEKATNLISVFPIYKGRLGDRISNPSSANTPFGFTFDKSGNLLVSEAAAGAPNGSSLSSYKLLDNGRLKAITPSAKTNQTAACWAVLSKNGKYVYVSNTGSGTLSGFKVKSDGSLVSLTSDGQTGIIGAGSGPIDMAVSRNGDFLNSLNTGNGTISTFQISEGGALKSAFTQPSIPTSANGLVVR